MKIASLGHSGSQMSQLMQSSLINRAIFMDLLNNLINACADKRRDITAKQSNLFGHGGGYVAKLTN